MLSVSRYNIFLSIALVWIMAVLMLYFWIHKPLTPNLARAVGGAAVDFFSAAVIVLISGGVGRALTARWTEALSRVERLAGDALIGLGVVSVVMFVVGLLRLDFLSMAGLLLLLAGITWRHGRRWLLDFWQWIQGWNITTGLALFIGLCLLLALVMALAPPTAFDALTYQLVGAKVWFANGKFSALPGNPSFGFPQLVNTLYAGQMALLDGRFTGAGALHWLFGCLTLMTIGGYGARRFNANVGQLAAGIFLVVPPLWMAFSWANVNLAAAAYGMLTLILLDEWRRDDENTLHPGWLVLAAVSTGLLLSVTYGAVIFAAVAGLYVLIYAWKRGSFKQMGQQAALFVVIAGIAAAPWLARNAVYYDNPIYPLLTTTGERDALTQDWYLGFVYMMSGLLAVLAAVTLDSLRHLPEKPLNLAQITRTLVTLIFALTTVNYVTGTRPRDMVQEAAFNRHFLETRALDYLMGVIDADQYLDENLDWYIAAMREVNNLPDDSHVLFLWEARSLYCDEPRITCEEDSNSRRWWQDRREIGSAESIVESWKNRGVTHVLVWETERDSEMRDNPIFEESDITEWVAVPALLDVVWQDEDIYTLFEIPPAPLE